MRRLAPAVLLALATACSACSPAQQPAPKEPEGSPIPEESKAMVRQGDEAVLAAQKQMDAEIDKNQADLEKAMKAAVGKEAPSPGGAPPMPAAKAIGAMPLSGTASLEDAKKYVDSFEQNVAGAKKLYEEQMRKTFGDAEYEAKYKPQLDGMFAQAASATKAISATELMADVREKYKADLEKCARGEKPPPGSVVGQDACKRAKASANSDGTLSPEALQTLLGGAANEPEPQSQGGLLGLLDSIPGVAQVKLALEGVAALKDGDTSKVLQLAGDLVPIPGVRSVLQSASQAIAAAKKAGKGR